MLNDPRKGRGRHGDTNYNPNYDLVPTQKEKGAMQQELEDEKLRKMDKRPNLGKMFQEGGMTDEDLDKYKAKQSSGTSGGFPPVAGGSRRSVSVSPDGMSGGIGPAKPQSSGMMGRNESMVGKAAKALVPGGMGASSGLAAAAKRKKEQEYKSGGFVKAADGCAKRGKTKGTMVRMK